MIVRTWLIINCKYLLCNSCRNHKHTQGLLLIIVQYSPFSKLEQHWYCNKHLDSTIQPGIRCLIHFLYTIWLKVGKNLESTNSFKEMIIFLLRKFLAIWILIHYLYKRIKYWIPWYVDEIDKFQHLLPHNLKITYSLIEKSIFHNNKYSSYETWRIK